MSSEAKIKQVEGITFIGKGNSGHWITMDGPEEFGGANAATRPMELILLGLGGCTGSDVASLLRKMRVPVTKFDIDIKAERADEHPKVYTSIHLFYRFWGSNLTDEKDKIEKAIQLSQDKYCSVSTMLKNARVSLQYSFEVYPQ